MKNKNALYLYNSYLWYKLQNNFDIKFIHEIFKIFIMRI